MNTDIREGSLFPPTKIICGNHHKSIKSRCEQHPADNDQCYRCHLVTKHEPEIEV